MKTGRLITLQMLEDAEACFSQIEEFKTRFGDSVAVTKKLCMSVAQVFDWRFAARHFLSEPLLEEFDRQEETLWEEYNRRTAPLREEYKSQVAPLWEKFERKYMLLREGFNHQCAVLFWKMYNSEA